MDASAKKSCTACEKEHSKLRRHIQTMHPNLSSEEMERIISQSKKKSGVAYVVHLIMDLESYAKLCSRKWVCYSN